MRSNFNRKQTKTYRLFPAKHFLVLFLLSNILIASRVLYAQSPSLVWQKPLGGTTTEGMGKMILSPEGGYLISGATYSNNYEVHGNHGNSDAWIVNLKNNKDTLWTKCYGGSSDEAFSAVQSTIDGNYVAAGYTYSNNGDVHHNHGNSDAWIVKLKSNGDTLWSKCYGGSGDDFFYSITATSDGGYIACGSSSSSNGDVSGNHGATDAWIVKLDANGNIIWQKCYGGSGADAAYFYSESFYAIKETPGNGYIAVGYTNSNDGDISGNHGGSDYWVIKIDQNGLIQWNKCYGSSKPNSFYIVEAAKDLVLTSDNGYLVIGDSEGIDGDISSPKGGNKSDIWVIKLDATGTIQWEKSYGGTAYETGSSVNVTASGGYLIGGSTASSNGDLLNNPVESANDNAWIIKTDALGNILWNKQLGNNSGTESVVSVFELPDGSIVAGSNLQGTPGEGVGIRGSVDCWVFKLSPCPAPLLIAVTTCSNKAYDFYGTPLTTAGVYRDTVARTSACPNYVELNLTIIPAPENIVITQTGNTLSTGDFSNYQWLVNNKPLAYAAGKKTITSEGNNDYRLIVTGANGCKSDTTDAFTFLYNGCEAPAIDWAKSYGGTATDQAFSITALSNGYLISGRSNSVNGDVKGIHGTANDLWVLKINNNGDTLWTKTLGGNGIENGYAIRATSDGGFIIVGESAANATTGSIGTTPRPVASSTTDAWILKYSSAGLLEWQKLYGGTGAENVYSIEPVSDGYIVAGSVPAASTTGTLAGTVSNGSNDGWILKLNTDGSLAWQKRYGGGGADYIHSIKPTSDGGYVAVGYSVYNASTGTLGSTARPVTGAGSEDAWVIKMDANGAIEWQKLFGGSGADRAYAIAQTADGGYVLSGYAAATSTDGTLTGIEKPGSNDFWLLKLDNTGTLQWQKVFGGTGSDQALSFDLLVEPNGYVFSGFSASIDGNAIGNKGNNDLWIIKTDLNGVLQWQKLLGGTAADQANSIAPANGGGYIVAGHASAGEISDNKGGIDYYIVKLNACRTCTSPTFSSICEGDSYDFNGTALIEAGVYRDITDVNGCQNIQALNLNVDPAYTTPLTDAICSGTTYDFHGTILTTSGTFTHLLTTTKGCDSTLSLTLSVRTLPSPVITANGSQLSTGNFVSYEWLKENIPTGTTTQTYTPTENGSYRVVVADANGCRDTSAIFTYTISGITNRNAMNGVQLHPNPVVDQLIVSSEFASIELVITSTEGKEFLTQKIQREGTINTSTLSQGLYIIKVYENGILKGIQKLIKK